MKNFLLKIGTGSGLFALSFFPSILKADGCYVCQGQTNTFVFYTGKDTYKKRRSAETCGCRIGGTTISCNAANHRILCKIELPTKRTFPRKP